MPLEKRMFICENCKLEIDRDLNAAINIKKLTIKELEKRGIELNITAGLAGINAFGDRVRPLISYEVNGSVDELGTIYPIP